MTEEGWHRRYRGAMKQPTLRLVLVEAAEQALKFRVWGMVRRRGSAAGHGVAVADVSVGACGRGDGGRRRWRWERRRMTTAGGGNGSSASAGGGERREGGRQEGES
jgi:hypothetical protein